jgi:WD40 repeat protein
MSKKNRIALTNVAAQAGKGKVRDMVPSATGSNKGLFGVIHQHEPPWLIDTETGQRLTVLGSLPVVGMAFRPVKATEINSERTQEVAIVYGASANRVDFYDASLGEWLPPYACARAQCVAYSQQGDKVAIGSAHGSVIVLDINDGHRRKELFLTLVCKSPIVRIAFTGQGESLIAVTASGALYSVDIASGRAKEQILVGAEEDMDFECRTLALHDCARLAVFAGSVNRGSGRCKVWVCDLDNGSRLSIDTGHTVFVRSVMFLSGYRILVIGDNGAEVYDLETRKRLFSRHTGDTLGVAYSAMKLGPFTFVIGTAGTVKVSA